MDDLHQKVMSLGRFLEFRRHHEVAVDYQGVLVAQTRAEAVFQGEPAPGDSLLVAQWVLGDPVAPGFSRQYAIWPDSDDYGRQTVVVHYTDTEVARAACGTQTS